MTQQKAGGETLILGVTLALYAAVACCVLAVVNNVTAPRIALNKTAKANMAMKAVLAEADSFEPVEHYTQAANSSIDIQSVYVAKKGGEVIGGVAQVSGPSYDKATIIVGMTADGTVGGLQFLELTDSPGFGLKANDPTFTLPSGKTFYGQFEGKSAKDGFTAGQTFDTISGATITSVAVGNLIQAGTECLFQVLQGGEQ